MRQTVKEAVDDLNQITQQGHDWIDRESVSEREREVEILPGDGCNGDNKPDEEENFQWRRPDRNWWH